MLKDFRFAFRQIFKNRSLAAAAIVTLALGIGANTAIFSVINSVLLKTLPYPEPERLAQVFEAHPEGQRNSVSGGAFKDWKENNSSFSNLAVFEEIRVNLTGAGRPERLAGLRVSSEFLPALGVEPQLGRQFADHEDQVGSESRLVVLSHELWQERFGGNAKVLGASVLLSQEPHTVIGVLPPGALFHDRAQFLTPIVIDGDPEQWLRHGHWRSVIGRLASGVSMAQAQTELREIKERLSADYPSFKDDWTVAVVPYREAWVGDSRSTLVTLFAAVGLVLFIACANVANLLLARGNARSREMAIRGALGAHKWQIVRQMLVESLLLALMGCAGGLLLAAYGVDYLAQTLTRQLPQTLLPKIDLGVLTFSIVASCVCGLLFGILPALRASRFGLSRDLKEAERGLASRATRRSQMLLVISEFALTLVLLVGSGLFLRSFIAVLDADPGFNPDQALAFDLSFAEAQYPEGEDRLRFIASLRQKLEALPGVNSVGATSALPLSREGRTEFAATMEEPDRTDYLVGCNFISGDYFETMGMTLVRGRRLTAADNAAGAAPVAVIDTQMAGQLFANLDPLGQQLRSMAETWTVVGVVAPVRHWTLDIDPTPSAYFPQSFSPRETSVVVRTALAPESLVQAIRKTVLEEDPGQPIANVRTLEQAVSRSLEVRRTTLVLVSLFAVVAVSLACLGIYGVMSFAIGQRARELGIRSIFGASKRDVIALIFQDGLKPSLAGIGLGLVAALALGKLVESLLFEVAAYDPWVLFSATSILCLVAVLSIFGPALRAANADPIRALRAD